MAEEILNLQKHLVRPQVQILQGSKSRVSILVGDMVGEVLGDRLWEILK